MAKRKKKEPPLTEAETKLLQEAARIVWDECAYDVLQATADEKGKSVDEVTVSRAVAIEIALDAGRPEEVLEQRLIRARKAAEDVTALESLLKKLDISDDGHPSYEDLIAAVKPAFPHARYGT